jgi:hypothetical protein
MNCVPFEEKIALYVDGALDWNEARAVEQHLRNCPDCAEFADRMEFDRMVLRTPPPECAEVDFDGLRAKIRRDIKQERRRQLMPVLALAASILLAVGAWLHFGTRAVREGDGSRQVSSGEPRGPAAPPAPPPFLTGQAAPPAPRPRARARQPKTPVPQADLALEAALQEFVAAEETSAAAAGPAPAVAIRIVTGDPNVVLILLQESSGVSNE